MIEKLLPRGTIPKGTDDALATFPFDSFNTYQDVILRYLYHALVIVKAKNVILKCPPGFGKTALAWAAAHWFETSWFSVVNHGLIGQYQRDFKISDIKGKKNFMCEKKCSNCEIVKDCKKSKICRKQTVDNAICNSNYECDVNCAYKRQIEKGMQKKHTLTTPHWLFLFSENEKRKRDPRFHRNITVYDEGHNICSIANDVSAADIRKDVIESQLDIAMPKTEDTATIYAFLQTCKQAIDDLLKQADMFEEVKYKNIQREIIKGINAVRQTGNFSATLDKFGNLNIRQTFLKDFEKNYLDKISDQRIFMSGTLYKEDLINDLGLNPDDCYYIEMTKSTFPVANRRIYALCNVRLSREFIDKEENKRKLCDTIEKILLQYPNKRGLILPFTHKLRELIQERVGRKHSRLVSFGADVRERNRVLDYFFEHKDEPLVLNSTYVNEGYDFGFFDDGTQQVDFLILVKTPFPDVSDKFLQERMKFDERNMNCRDVGEDGLCKKKWCGICHVHYCMMVQARLEQMSCRANRSKEQKCMIFILDWSFKNSWKRKLMRHASEWWKEALVWA